MTVPDLYLTGGTGRNRIKLLKLVAEISKYLQKKIHLLPYDDSTESSQICV